MKQNTIYRYDDITLAILSLLDECVRYQNEFKKNRIAAKLLVEKLVCFR